MLIAHKRELIYDYYYDTRKLEDFIIEWKIKVFKMILTQQ